MLKYSPDVPLQDSEPATMPSFQPDFAVISQIIYKLRRNWLEKNFALRKVLVRWQAVLDVLLLKSSTPFDVVFAANDQWLYLSQENPNLNVINDYRSIDPLTKEDLAHWCRLFRERRDWLAARGIAYLVVVAPNKVTVYPEHLPHRFRRVREWSKYDQMIAALRAAGIDVLDLRPAMFKARTEMLTYYRTDTHWTPFGAFRAYQEVARHLLPRFPRMQPRHLDDFTISEEPGLLGGLSYMIALGDLFQEKRMVFTPKFQRKAKEVEGTLALPNQFQPLAVYENADRTLPRAVVIRDSFAHEMIPFLSEHFSRVLYTWPYPTDAVSEREFDKAIIEAEKPNLVIDEFVERYFTEKPPPQPVKAER
ncbi:alginate O-acetyltransferase [Fundidesulfovibrio butyratiphilus]